jgi:chloramphenicol 3-O phosphotransferase
VAKVIVLNGTSSSGKTTIARAVQELAPRRFLNFSIDSILYTLPPRDLERIVRGGSSDDLADLHLPQLVRAFYACVRQLLELGHDLIVDHAVTAAYHRELLGEAIASHEVLLVGLDCPPEILRERERARGDRRLGMAEVQAARIHTLLEYDLRIDTSMTSPEEAAARIVGHEFLGAAR